MQSVDYANNRNFKAAFGDFVKSKCFNRSVFMRGHVFSYIGSVMFIYGLQFGQLVDNIKVLVVKDDILI